MIIAVSTANVVFASILIWGSQLFPTLIKARATGISALFGRIGGMLMSVFMYCVIEFDPNSYIVYLLTVTFLLTFVTLNLIKFLKYPDEQVY